MKKYLFIALLPLLASCGTQETPPLSNSDESESSSSFCSSVDEGPYSFVNTDVTIPSYLGTDTEYEVKGKTLVFNFCMKANKSWSALQMQAGGGEIYNKDEIRFNHVVVVLRNDSTSQYTSGEDINLYYGSSLKPTADPLSTDKASGTDGSVPTYTLTYSLDATYTYWRLSDDVANASYLLSATFSVA